MNGELTYVCIHACLMSSKKFGYAVNVRILEWSWHGENVVYFLYVVDSSSNMLGKFYLYQWGIYEVACVKNEKICFFRMDMLKLNLKAIRVIRKVPPSLGGTFSTTLPHLAQVELYRKVGNSLGTAHKPMLLVCEQGAGSGERGA